MKLFRVGICLAFLTAVAACSQAPQSVTTPSATVGGSTAAAADGSTLKVTAPALVSPVNSERAEDRRPFLIWLNSTGTYGSTGLEYELELSTPTTVIYRTVAGESPDISSHLIPIELDYDVVYSWRVRAKHTTELGPWSNWASFMSPTRPVATVPTTPTSTPTGSTSTGYSCAAPQSPLDAGTTRRPRPNDSRIVNQVASAFPSDLRNSCQDHGGNWNFMDRVVDALRAYDGRYAYNCKRGNCLDPSQDVVTYYYGAVEPNNQGRSNVYIFDIISGHCGSFPGTVWLDVTDVTAQNNTTGGVMYPRRGGPSNTARTCGT
jgi:hypothetical protein